jgi:hypothetical protein
MRNAVAARFLSAGLSAIASAITSAPHKYIWGTVPADLREDNPGASAI